MKVEVQLRTIAMEFWANLEHQLRYKKNLPPRLLAETEAQLNECAQLSSVLDAKMQSIKDTIEASPEEDSAPQTQFPAPDSPE